MDRRDQGAEESGTGWLQSDEHAKQIWPEGMQQEVLVVETEKY